MGKTIKESTSLRITLMFTKFINVFAIHTSSLLFIYERRNHNGILYRMWAKIN